MFVTIDRNDKLPPLTKQLYNQMRELIMSGQLEKDKRIPSSRQLAYELKLSRVVVVEVYEQLLAEGYLYSKSGAGTFVMGIEGPRKPCVEREVAPVDFVPTGNPRDSLRTVPESSIVDMRTGAPNLSIFPPLDKWGGKIYRDICHSLVPERLDYYKSQGSYELRHQILAYLKRTRGVIADTEQVVITTGGAAQGFTLIARTIISAGDDVVLEDPPINNDIYEMLATTGARIHSVKVDDEGGLMVDQIPKDIVPKLVFTTPSHQYPMGAIMSINRRLALIDVLKQSGGYIIEDDYDSAYRYKGSPVSALHSLDSEQVIYAGGTFSKLLFPALRIGYVILPRKLIEPFRRAKHLQDIHTPILEQLTLARFIEEGLLERHIRKAKKHYGLLNEYLNREVSRLFGGEAKIIGGDEAGIHLVVRFKSFEFDDEVLKQLSNKGLRLASMKALTIYPSIHKKKK